MASELKTGREGAGRCIGAVLSAEAAVLCHTGWNGQKGSAMKQGVRDAWADSPSKDAAEDQHRAGFD